MEREPGRTQKGVEERREAWDGINAAFTYEMHTACQSAGCGGTHWGSGFQKLRQEELMLRIGLRYTVRPCL